MLTLIEVRSATGELLSLPLTDITSGLVVEEVLGLDPVKATLVSSSFANLDGAQFQSSRRETRNIKLKIGLEPDYITTSVQDLRKRLYSFLMPGKPVSLRLYMADGLTVDINGRVETHETATFTKEPVADISILCFDPDFFDPTQVTFSGSSTSTEDMSDLMYDGTVETGIVFRFSINRTMSAFSIYHLPADGFLYEMSFAGSMLNGDVLEISTIPGNKYAILTRAGVSTSVLYAVSPFSKWLELQPGNNGIRVYATGAGVPYTIAYTNKYGGL